MRKSIIELTGKIFAALRLELNGVIVDDVKERILLSMQQYAEQEAVAFLDWSRINLINDGAPLSYHFGLKRRLTTDESYQLFKQQQDENSSK